MRSFLSSLKLGLLLLTLAAPASAQNGVLVFGGTGQLGREIVSALVEAGEDVTVFVRPSSDRSALDPLGVTFVTGDVLTQADVNAALKSGPYKVVIDALARDGGVEAAFYIDSMKYIAAAAKETGVKQVILHGSVGAGLSHLSDRDPGGEFSDLMLAKGLGERYLMESGVPYTIIRNWALLPARLKETGAAFLTEDQSARGLITRDALARLTLECMDQAHCLNEIFHAVDDATDFPEPFKSRLKAQRDWEAQNQKDREAQNR